jgi:hypothetical protein
MKDHEASAGRTPDDANPQPHRSEAVSPSAGSATLRGFIGAHGSKILLVSAVLLIPCFWQRHIAAGDFSSHLYNAWLAQLIRQGRAPGLWIVPVWNNVLFDWILSGSASLFGFAAAEKLAAALAVLLFFWGAFAFAWAVARRAPWNLAPCLAMVAYGWTFHAGFFNYYLSVGLSFWGLAIFLKVNGWKRWLALALAPLVVLGHPMGIAWFLGAVAYAAVAPKLPGRCQVFLLLAPAAALTGLHFYLWSRFTPDNVDSPVYLYQGADQLALSADRHTYVAAAALAFGAVCFALDAVRRRRDPGYFRRAGLALQLYVIAQLAVFLMPDTLFLPMYTAPFGWIVERLTLISAVVGCALLVTMEPRRWHAAGFAVIAAAFFFLTYRETQTLGRMEESAERLVGALPQGARVLVTILPRPASRIYFIDHMVDRACIGHCFAYGNYEPASKQFRLRALPGNSIVMADEGDVGDMEGGSYEVPEDAPPLYQVYQCNADFTQLCIRKLEAGEQNGRLSVRPE